MALSRRALTQRKIPSDPQGAPSNSLLFPSLSSQAHSLTACFPLRLAAVTLCVCVCGGSGGGNSGGGGGGVCVRYVCDCACN